MSILNFDDWKKAHLKQYPGEFRLSQEELKSKYVAYADAWGVSEAQLEGWPDGVPLNLTSPASRPSAAGDVGPAIGVIGWLALVLNLILVLVVGLEAGWVPASVFIAGAVSSLLLVGLGQVVTDVRAIRQRT